MIEMIHQLHMPIPFRSLFHRIQYELNGWSHHVGKPHCVLNAAVLAPHHTAVFSPTRQRALMRPRTAGRGVVVGVAHAEAALVLGGDEVELALHTVCL